MIQFDREICCNASVSAAREWLITNGIGGYAMGTVNGMLTRRYHGLLIAALNPPVGRTLLLTKIDEMVTYMGRTYPFYVNRWRNGYVDPTGYRWLRKFHLEGTTPVWTYPLGNGRLEKRVWMPQGANTTYITYTLADGEHPVELELKALVNYRDHHNNTHADEWQMTIEPVEHGLRIRAHEEAVPLNLLINADAEITPLHEWVRDFYLSIEAYRGYDAFDDNLHAATFELTLTPEASVTLVATAEPDLPALDGPTAYKVHRMRDASLLVKAGEPEAPEIRQLTLTADQFIVQRPIGDADEEGRSIVAGYPWFTDWGRDTMISLPGLTLTTGRPEIARQILRTYAHFVDQGMLPNRFPDAATAVEYNTVDATLWYFEALRAYHAATGDESLIRELFPTLQEIIACHQKGTRYQIHVDEDDGLLYAGEPGIQLTWMDAKVGDWVVTPRVGKPVEVNALWYHALCTMAEFAKILDEPSATYEQAAERAREGFARFWSAELGYCYDVLDGPEGDDDTLRPNQLLAVSLPHSPLTPKQQRAVVEVCEVSLLTPRGLRSLARDDPRFVGRYGGDLFARDGAYHQGTVWAWLIGPFVMAHLRVHRDPEAARAYLTPMLRHLREHGVGAISEIFDGNAPFAPRGCVAQAWSVAEFLRVWQAIDRFKRAD